MCINNKYIVIEFLSRNSLHNTYYIIIIIYLMNM